MSTTEKTPGQIAFEAYNESKGGRTYDGKPIPPWEAIENRGDGHGVKIAWEAAAEAAYAAIASRMSVESWLIGAKSAADAGAAYAFSYGVECAKGLALKACDHALADKPSDPVNRAGYENAGMGIQGHIQAIDVARCSRVEGQS